ncbi:MAG: putative glycine dehydrogenase (decarboxylating) subunit 1 [Planctomycetaceae bacterium]|nr:MAG: putative glycine dehydrogenase (decarboxylating) subunit 1 [Planctomycetaceae bacterium]
MLEKIGVASLDDLLQQIPPDLRLQRPLALPAPLTELELEQEVRRLAARNVGSSRRSCFLGGGVYDHFVPSVVDEVAGRGEFYTAYTPYQPEASQGSLQAFFEYQSMMCALTGLDAANASLYEGASAVAEAILMAERSLDRSGPIFVSAALHPETLSTIHTYLARWRERLCVIPTVRGVTDWDWLARRLNDQTLAVVFQHPNFFGCLEDAARAVSLAHRVGALGIQSFDPISLGIMKRPGDYGVDIAVAEGQSLGIPLQYGGPYLGVLACRQQFLRKMPGRIVGRTVDRLGRPCFVLNLQTREQHIRREKATSNICTNQGLMALRAAVYLALQGPQGMREVAQLCCRKAHYAAQRLQEVAGVSLMFAAPFFKEFCIRLPGDLEHVLQQLRQAGCDVGPSLQRFPCPAGMSVQDYQQGCLVAVTEARTREEIDHLAEAMAQALSRS